MTLTSMVVSRDWQEVSVLECILGGLHIDCDVESEPQRAQQKLASRKVDALIVDCDLRGSDQFLRDLQHDTQFPLEQPISVEQAVRTLSAARQLILDRRLRYHRQNVEASVALASGAQKKTQGALMNLSQGGIGIRLDREVQVRQPLQISFRLPGTRHTVKARGEVAWTD